MADTVINRMAGTWPTVVPTNVHISSNAVTIIVCLGPICVMAKVTALCQMMKELVVNSIVYICFIVHTPPCVFM